ncbi:uncharacterized protein LOC120340153 isoform X1 [Styela clava]
MSDETEKKSLQDHVDIWFAGCIIAVLIILVIAKQRHRTIRAVAWCVRHTWNSGPVVADFIFDVWQVGEVVKAEIDKILVTVLAVRALFPQIVSSFDLVVVGTPFLNYAVIVTVFVRVVLFYRSNSSYTRTKKLLAYIGIVVSIAFLIYGNKVFKDSKNFQNLLNKASLSKCKTDIKDITALNFNPKPNKIIRTFFSEVCKDRESMMNRLLLQHHNFNNYLKIKDPRDLFSDTDNRQIRFVGIVGGYAGCRSSLLDSFTKHVLKNGTLGKNAIKYTRRVNFNDLPKSNSISVGELLFADISKDDAEQGINEINMDSTTFLIIIDGIESIENILKQGEWITDHKQKSTSENILKSLFTGHLWNGTRILTIQYDPDFVIEINKRTREMASEFKFMNYSEQNFEVYPELTAVNYYEDAANRPEYRIHREFSKQIPKQKGDTMDIISLFSDIDPNPVSISYVALIGGAGYGKTELCKKFSLKVLDGLVEELDEVEAVHLITFRELASDDSVAIGQLLFGRFFPEWTGEKIDTLINWIIKHPKKFLLVLDGADQYPKKLGESFIPTDYHSRNEATLILNALFDRKGRLFPGMRLLISSREHAIRDFRVSLRPQRVVQLNGLKLEDVETLVLAYGGEYGTAVWNHLQEKSPDLLNICQIPMFLVFTVVALKDHMNEPTPPQTLTEILMLVLSRQLIVSDEHVNKMTIVEVIHQLKRMSFEGIKNERVTFTWDELPKNITIKILERDLIIPIPGTTGKMQSILEGNLVYFFCHQSLQEAFSALYIVELSYDEFKKVIPTYLHNPKWAVIRRLVCGILLNNTTRKIARGLSSAVSLLRVKEESLDESVRFLRASLTEQLTDANENTNSRNFVDLMYALSECHEGIHDIINSNLHSITMERISVSRSDIHVIRTLIAHVKELEIINFDETNIPVYRLEELGIALLESQVKIHAAKFGSFSSRSKGLLKQQFIFRDLLKQITSELHLTYENERPNLPILEKEIENYPTLKLVILVKAM